MGASQPASSSATGGAGRSTATVVPGWSSRHTAARRSTSPSATAGSKPGLGRNGASSVSGTGFVGQAP